MQMDAFLWMFLPVFVAGGSALLSFYIMQARMEVALSKERETLAEARAMINTQRVTMEERVKATEESTKRLAMDEFMQDFRVEERSYVRDSKTQNVQKRSMVMQERLFFRNIPLSNWIEHEMTVQEGFDLEQLPESVFHTAAIGVGAGASSNTNEGRLPISKLLNDLTGGRQTPQESTSLMTSPMPSPMSAPHFPAFGAQ